MLFYSLHKNNLVSGDPDNLLARPTNLDTKSLHDLIEKITGPGSILKRTEANAVIKSYWGTIADYIRQGKTYRDEFVSISFSITGNFTHPEDEFDPQRHNLKINCLLKATITQVAEEVQLRKVDANQIVPVIDEIYDWGSKTTAPISPPETYWRLAALI